MGTYQQDTDSCGVEEVSARRISTPYQGIVTIFTKVTIGVQATHKIMIPTYM